jgi:hypothetical protein
VETLMRARLLLILLSLPLVSTAVAQQFDRVAVFTQNKRAALKITVTGRDASGISVERNGSGVMVRSSGVIVTSSKLIGREDELADGTAGQRARTIEVFALDGNGVARSIGRASATIVPGYDVAILRITGENFSHASIDDTPVTGLPSVVTIIWDPMESVPTPITGDIVPTDNGRYGDGLTIRIPTIEGHEGAGVFGANGRLVGVITKRIDQTRVLAAPIYSWNTYLPPPSRVRPNDAEVAACETEERARRVARQPFSVGNGIRCENMGNSKHGVVSYRAPPNFTIAGQVSAADETNYGTVGAVEYRKEGDRVTEVKVELNCSTPNRPFGPGGWASSTLTGFIERILSQSELTQIRQSCLKRH